MIRTNRFVSIIAVIGGLFVTGTAMASGPALESKCGAINNPVGGPTSAAYLSEDCRQLFVLPPTVGKASVSGVSTKTNLNFCPAVLKVGDVATSTINSAAIVAEKIEQMITDFDPLSAEIDALQAAVNEASRVRAIAKDEWDRVQTVKTELTADLATAKSDLDLCKLLSSCTNEQAIYDAALATLKTFLTTEYIPAQKANSTANANYTSAFSALQSATTNYATALEPLFSLQAKLVELNASVTQLYNQYVRLSGFTAKLTYGTGWDTAVANFQGANPSKTVTKLPIKRPRLAASAVGLQNFDTDTPSIIAFAVPGVAGAAAYDMMAQPTGTETMTSLTAQLDPTKQYEGAFGDSIGAQINVSLMGACPFYPKGLASGQVGDINDLTNEVAMNAFYSYDLQVRRGYTASYNMASWVSRIERVVKKGGFFSSKTLHEVVEDSNSSDWFSITFNASSGEFTYSPAEQERITEEVKGQLQERALLLLARQMNLMPTTGGYPSVPATQPTGAGAAASYLMKGCGYWSWCLGGSFVLSVLDSIFGSSSAVSSFKKSNNVWVTETVNGVAFLEQNGAMTYEK
jgi:hypothetical protein